MLRSELLDGRGDAIAAHAAANSSRTSSANRLQTGKLAEMAMREEPDKIRKNWRARRFELLPPDS
jgi:hypothetical protein